MIIDSHQHFWKYDPIRDSWIDDSMTVIRKDFLPQDLKPILEVSSVSGCIAVQADQSEEETHFLLQCAENHSFIKGVVGWVDLCAGNVEGRLEYFAKNKLFKGVRHIVQAENEEFVLREDFQNGISKLAQFNLVYDILVFPKHLKNVIQLVQKFPNQRFVLDHIAKPQMSAELDSEWVKQIQLLASFPNVSCKLSGLVTETENFEWKTSLFSPFLDIIVAAFGTDRLLFGSDWPVCLLAATYQEVLGIIEDYFVSFSDEEKQNIMANNAIKVYNL
ncbi:amidohydrolase [Flavobacterium sp. UMI-01]|uniref:amidohydrolase family protein n=1 Tax=Flavobacterium sp. UMI-01 TaxID=1441053 RepID=UPI001C7CD07C|nr:amidohydrolase family protein [Flavobacterium sp. UMI-01]GIZ09729.1 amidohydrolase [Flavobacterium sp. UMI-01]